MKSSKIIIYLSIIACIAIVGIPTLYKVISENHRKLYIVTNKMVIEAAEKCYYDDKCKSTKVTLKELYDNSYLTEKIIDPVTKEVYADNSYVLLKKVDSTFNPL